jgi:hypothetical protein
MLIYLRRRAADEMFVIYDHGCAWGVPGVVAGLTDGVAVM